VTVDNKQSIFVEGWYLPAQKAPSAFFNDRPLNEISVVVIHNISLPAGVFGNSNVHELFMGCLDCNQHPSFIDLIGLEVSAHFFINRQGLITQFVSLDKRAWHAGVSAWQGRANVNDFSVGVELEGTDSLPYTDEQYLQLATLTKDIMAKYAIVESAIVGHCDIAPGRKTDPGISFDWPRYRQSVKDEV